MKAPISGSLLQQMATGQPDFIGNVMANYRIHRRLRSHGVSEEDQPGTYRIKHYNTHKKIFSGSKVDFEGTSDTFKVV